MQAFTLSRRRDVPPDGTQSVAELAVTCLLLGNVIVSRCVEGGTIGLIKGGKPLLAGHLGSDAV